MVRNKKAEILGDWIARARAIEGTGELNRFAKGISDEFSAIQAALSLPWSNGQVEGQVNRLKLIKRQMYGRANFDLLRQRVLYRV
ncbi:MAG: transposase [Pirellulales bacterium]|nr:transposase [Pirellulales bacterium]